MRLCARFGEVINWKIDERRPLEVRDTDYVKGDIGFAAIAALQFQYRIFSASVCLLGIELRRALQLMKRWVFKLSRADNKAECSPSLTFWS